MAEKAILIDTSKCIACKGCQIACKQWNELAAGKSEFFAPTGGYENPSDLSFHTYNLVKFHLDEKPNGDPDWLFRKYQCMHCTDAPCFEVCPKQGLAIKKDSETGFVDINRAECIGCKSCAGACPYNIPKFPDEDEVPEGEEFPRMYKCWGCLNRQADDRGPACVQTCAPGAAVYGDRSAMVAQAQARKAELEAQGKAAFLYGVDELGGQHYIYVLLREPSFYGLPDVASLKISTRRAYLQYLKGQGEKFLKKVSSF